MPGQSPGRDDDHAAPRFRIAVIAALGAERACLERGLPPRAADRILRYQCGPGTARAARSAARAVADGAAGLVSWGFAGALQAGLDAGTVLLPTRVQLPGGIGFRVDAAWQRRLLNALAPRYRCESGGVLAVDRVLATPAAKARAAAQTSAVAVDMESAAIARAAARRALPFVVVRVVVDQLDDALPPGVERWLDDAGNRRLRPLAAAAVTPRRWPDLWVLAGRHRQAAAVLSGVARHVACRDFLHPGAERFARLESDA